MFVGIHCIAVYLWYELMLTKYFYLQAVYLWYELMLTKYFYLQKQVGKGSILCSCAKSSARQKKTSQSKPNHFLI
jgi:hypothetical protein